MIMMEMYQMIESIWKVYQELVERLDNVVLSNIYNVPAIAVDTHVARVSKRLELTKSIDVLEIERDLMKFFPENKWSRVHHQLVLFGRYTL